MDNSQQHSDSGNSPISYVDYESLDHDEDIGYQIDELEREQLQSWLESIYDSFCDADSESIDGVFDFNKDILQSRSPSNNCSSCDDEEDNSDTCNRFLQIIDYSACVQFSSEPGSTTFCSLAMLSCDKPAKHPQCEKISSAFPITSEVPSIQDLSQDPTPDLVSLHTNEHAVSPPKLSYYACSDFSKQTSFQFLFLPVTSTSFYPSLAFNFSLKAFELGRDPPCILNIGDSRFGFG